MRILSLTTFPFVLSCTKIARNLRNGNNDVTHGIFKDKGSGGGDQSIVLAAARKIPDARDAAAVVVTMIYALEIFRYVRGGVLSRRVLIWYTRGAQDFYLRGGGGYETWFILLYGVEVGKGGFMDAYRWYRDLLFSINNLGDRDELNLKGWCFISWWWCYRSTVIMGIRAVSFLRCTLLQWIESWVLRVHLKWTIRAVRC